MRAVWLKIMAMNDSTSRCTMSVNRSSRIAIRRATLSEDGEWGSSGVCRLNFGGTCLRIRYCGREQGPKGTDPNSPMQYFEGFWVIYMRSVQC